MTAAPFEIYPYSIEQLTKVFAEKSAANSNQIKNKIHLIYFREYFENIHAQTILVEKEYIDRDFLEDYSFYYVRCFPEYERKCSRLHFFKNKFDRDTFDALLLKKDSLLKESLQENYLGFIVVKPLPLTIIGRTCLVTYPEEAGESRNFPITRKYHVHLFGISLTVNSLAFQEQDNVVAACATSALWSAFHGTGVLFQHNILSPVEITKAATKQLPIETRTFPNKGLSAEQMAHAIQGVNLEPYLIGINNKEYNIKSSIYAYLRFGIPVILGVDLYETSGGTPTFMGKHAVVVSGYRLEADLRTNYQDEDLELTSFKISKIYVHDDQVGPFSRMEFDDNKIELHEDGSKKNFISLTTSWKTGEIKMGDIRAVPQILLVPLYHKIRIPFETIHETIKYFNAVIDGLNEAVPILAGKKLEWDIHLTDVNNLKSEIFNSEQYAGSYFREILLRNMPRFIWRATALMDRIPAVDLLFDATDIEQGHYFVCAVEYNKNFCSILGEIFREDIFEETLKSTTTWKIIQWFREGMD
jgi:hypothetical protein